MSPAAAGWLGPAALAVLAACATAHIGDPIAGDGGTPDGPPVTTPDAAPGAPDARIADAAPPPDAAPCVEGDLNAVDPISGTCYLYFASAVPWDIARAACLALVPPAHLPTATSLAENNVLAALGPAAAADVWMGGTDAATEMTWLWITAEPMLYTNWRLGEPNDGDVDGEDCMVMEVDNGGTWDDRYCPDPYTFFCERP